MQYIFIYIYLRMLFVQVIITVCVITMVHDEEIEIIYVCVYLSNLTKLLTSLVSLNTIHIKIS